MFSKNNHQLMAEKYIYQHQSHYGLRKLSIGVASVLLGTTLYMGTALADPQTPSQTTTTVSTSSTSNPGTTHQTATSDSQPTNTTSAQTTKTISETILTNQPNGDPDQPDVDTHAVTFNRTATDQPWQVKANSDENKNPNATIPEVDIPQINGYVSNYQTIGAWTIDPNQDQSRTYEINYYKADQTRTIQINQPTGMPTKVVQSIKPNQADQTLFDPYKIDPQKINGQVPDYDLIPAVPAELVPTSGYHQLVEVNYVPVEKQVTRTITLHLPDGTLKPINQAVNFTRNYTYDQNTGKIQLGNWVAENSGTFPIPTYDLVIKNDQGVYLADQLLIPTEPVTITSANQTVDVNYTKVTPQQASVTLQQLANGKVTQTKTFNYDVYELPLQLKGSQFAEADQNSAFIYDHGWQPAQVNLKNLLTQFGITSAQNSVVTDQAGNQYDLSQTPSLALATVNHLALSVATTTRTLTFNLVDEQGQTVGTFTRQAPDGTAVNLDLATIRDAVTKSSIVGDYELSNPAELKNYLVNGDASYSIHVKKFTLPSLNENVLKFDSSKGSAQRYRFELVNGQVSDEQLATHPYYVSKTTEATLTKPILYVQVPANAQFMGMSTSNNSSKQLTLGTPIAIDGGSVNLNQVTIDGQTYIKCDYSKVPTLNPASEWASLMLAFKNNFLPDHAKSQADGSYLDAEPMTAYVLTTTPAETVNGTAVTDSDLVKAMADANQPDAKLYQIATTDYNVSRYRTVIELVDDDDNQKVVKEFPVYGKTEATDAQKQDETSPSIPDLPVLIADLPGLTGTATQLTTGYAETINLAKYGVDLTNSLPKGYEFVDQSTLPTSVTVTTTSDQKPVEVHVKHQHVTIKHDALKPGETLQGVAYNALNRTVTKTLELDYPNQPAKQIQKTYQIHRDADVDQATGKITYTVWNDVDLNDPAIQLPGYTPAAIADNTQPDLIKITYTANDQIMHIIYRYDDGQNVQTIHTDEVKGETDQTVATNSKVPDGYTLVPGQTLPANITFTGDKTPDISLIVVKNTDLSRVVSRMITIDEPATATTIKQDFHNQGVIFRRTASLRTDGTVKFSDWQTLNNMPTRWASFDAPDFEGYQPSQLNVPEKTVDVDTKNETVTITYSPINSVTTGETVITIQYLDADHNKQQLLPNTTLDIRTNRKDGNSDWQLTPADIKIVNGTTGVEVKSVDRVKYHASGAGLLTGQDADKTYDQFRVVIKIPSPEKMKHFQWQVAGYDDYWYSNDGSDENMEFPFSVIAINNDQAGKIPATFPVVFSNIMASRTVTLVEKGTHNPVGDAIYTNGEIGKTASIPKMTIPDGWELVNSKMPSTVEILAQDKPYEIPVQHKVITVASPKTTSDKLPDNPALTYPSGLSENNLTTTVNRKININDPVTKTPSTDQPVKLTRTAQVDEVTGKLVKYNDWQVAGGGNAVFPVFNNIPREAGYTPTQTTVPARTIDLKDPKNADDVNINYTADSQKAEVQFIDDTGETTIPEISEIDEIPIDGVTNAQIDFTKANDKLNNLLGIGYGLVANQTTITNNRLTPAKFDNQDGNVQTFAVKLIHKTQTVSHQNPINDGVQITGGNAKYQGVADTDLNKTVTRQITIHDPHQGDYNKTQTVTLHRDATVDMVTGTPKYTPWTIDTTSGDVSADEKGYKEYEAPTVPGYTVNSVKEEQIDLNNPDNGQPAEINYSPVDHEMHVTYHDVTTGQDFSNTVNGKTDQTVTMPSIPLGYVAMDEVPTTITFTGDSTPDKTINITPDTKDVDAFEDDAIEGTIKLTNSKFPAVEVRTANTIIRNIYVHMPDGTVKPVTQSVTLGRNAQINKVTGEVTYDSKIRILNPQTSTHFAGYTAPLIAGYTADKKVNPIDVNWDTNSDDLTKDIYYTADPQKAEVQFIDDTGETTIPEVEIDGVTNAQIDFTKANDKLNNLLGIGYDLVVNQTTITNNQLIPAKFDNQDDVEQTFKVLLKHHMQDVSHNQPGFGLTHDDLNKHVTRKITIHDPHQGDYDTTQTVTLHRNATVDLVTGTPKYTPWTIDTTTGDVSADGQGFKEYDAPTVPGYTGNSVKEATINLSDPQNREDTEVNYTANDGHQTIEYIDGDQVVKTQVINGKTDETKQVTPDIPKGYVLKDGQKVPTTVQIAPIDTPIKVIVEHGKTTVSHDKPQANGTAISDGANGVKFNGVTDSDLHKTVTRVIEVTKPDGQVTTETQMAKLHRDATVDNVTGDVTYTPWTTGTWDNYQVPSIPGYTASQTDFPEVLVTDKTPNNKVNVTYEANDGHQTIEYVDGNQVVKTQVIDGKTDETKQVTPDIPKGYVLKDGQKVPTIVKIAQTDMPIKVIVEHGKTTVSHDKPQANGTAISDGAKGVKFNGVTDSDLNKTVTRIIEVVKPDGQVTTETQTAKLHRDATVDNVTGDVTYTPWMSDNNFDEYQVPTVPGYTSTQSKVTAQIIDGNTPAKTTVKVGYIANDGQQTIQYVNQAAKVVGAQIINGKIDENINVTPVVPLGYVIKDGNQVPTSVKILAHDTPFTITVQDGLTKVTYDHPQANGTPIPHDKVGVMFRGVTKADLNKTVTRTITIDDPQTGTHQVVEKVQLHRDAQVDLVTGAPTYSKWQATGEFEQYTVPEVPGYTPRQKVVPDQTVDAKTPLNTTVEIKYVAQPVQKSGDQGKENKSHGTKEKGNENINPATNASTKKPLRIDTGNQLASSTKQETMNIGETPIHRDYKENQGRLNHRDPMENSDSHVAKLPQTGSYSAMSMVELGLVSVVTSLGLMLGMKKKHN